MTMTWRETVRRYPYEIRLRPGCFSGDEAPVVSRHRTLAAAVRQARRCDRWQVERSDRGGCLYALDTFKEAMRAATSAAREMGFPAPTMESGTGGER